MAGRLSAAIADAQESATQAERGFVEATAMLTTVRELQRLSGELQNALDQLARRPRRARTNDAARGAIEELRRGVAGERWIRSAARCCACTT